MNRSLDFTACIKQDTCPVEDCWRKLTKEEKDWLEKTPNRMYYADFSNECEKLIEDLKLWKIEVPYSILDKDELRLEKWGNRYQNERKINKWLKE